MVILYPTKLTFTQKGIVEDAPVFRCREDGSYWLHFSKEKLVRPLMDSGDLAIGVKNTHVYIGADIHTKYWNSFLIRDVQYENLAIKDVNADPKTIVQSVDTLQNEMYKRLELLFSNFRALSKGQEGLRADVTRLDDTLNADPCASDDERE